MKRRLDIDKIAKKLGAHREGRVEARDGYFGAMQIVAEIQARFRGGVASPFCKEASMKGLVGIFSMGALLIACGTSGGGAVPEDAGGAGLAEAGEDASSEADAIANEDSQPVDALPDTSPSCSCGVGYCCISGVCNTGNFHDMCGSGGVECDDCLAKVQFCREATPGTGDYRCVTLKKTGEACTGDAECENEHCDPALHTCQMPCAATSGSCGPYTGSPNCCDSTAICDSSGSGAPPGVCCHPKGTVEPADCGTCCNHGCTKVGNTLQCS